MNRPDGTFFCVGLLAGLVGVAALADVPDPNLPRGYGISPPGFPAVFADEDALPAAMAVFNEALDRLPNPVILWNGPWRDDHEHGSDAGQIPGAAEFVQVAAGQNDWIPAPVFGWRSGTDLWIRTPDNPVNDWSNTDARDRYAAMLAEYAQTHTPPIIMLGNENDFYYVQDADDYLNWIVAYNQAYDAIRAESEETLIGPVFNFEQLAGTGVLNGWTEPIWEALDLHDMNRVDVVALTSFPFLAHTTPAEVPADYLQPLVDHIGETPIVLTEIAWPAEDAGGLDPPWQTTPGAQLEFVKRIPALLQQTPVLGVVWPWLYKPTGNETELDWQIFAGISLFDADERPRPALEEWELLLDRILADRFELAAD